MAATHPSSSSFSNPNPNSLSLALHPSSISSSPRLLPSSPPCSTLITMNYSACYSASSSYSVMPCACFSPWKMSSSSSSTCKAVSRSSSIRSMAPDEEKMTRRSPLDFPIEWDRPRPGRRPDIFPQFSPMKTPLPQPPPTDPPEEDEEEEEKKEEENPDEEPDDKPPKET